MVLSLNQILLDIAAGEPHGTLSPRLLFRIDLPVEIDVRDDTGRRPIFFLPDLHILSSERADGYGEYFNLNHHREELLKHLLSRLVELRSTEQEYLQLRLFQLGDFHDLWRESEHWWWDEDVRSMIQRQVDSHRDLFDILSELDTERLVGNHDNRLRRPSELEKLQDEEIAEYFPADRIYPDLQSFCWGIAHRVDLIHADRFDKVETGAFHFLNPIGARLAQHGSINIGEVDEWQHELEPPGYPDGQADSGLLEENIDYSDTGIAEAKKKYYAETRDYVRILENIDSRYRDYPSVAAVIGHTHSPRIVSDHASPSFSLIDCGSWVNVSSAVGDPADLFWNAQLGVVTGNEIGVVQIGG